MPELQVITETLGGSALAGRGMAGEFPAWFEAAPVDAAGWRARLAGIAPKTGWAHALAPAFSGPGELPPRLAGVANAGGVVVTTGQQPGLFGGPLYTLAKALTALELADALQAVTGRPVAPVFWAATDDADFVEATRVWCRTADGAQELRQEQGVTEGIPMAEVPLAGHAAALETLLHACGSAADPGMPLLVQGCYRDGVTIGQAYLELLRGLLEPLGIAVLDASHPAVRSAARPFLVQALHEAVGINAALRAREAEIVAAGLTPQVVPLPDMSLVFTRAFGRKVRVSVTHAPAVADDASAEISPNVLLRPAVERQLLPTAAYVAGPGEFAYFAQVTAVAKALGWPVPLAVPRWSGTVLEPVVRALLERAGVDWRALADPHAVEHRVAAAAAPAPVMDALAAMRRAVRDAADAVQASMGTAGTELDPRVVEGTVHRMQWRVDRLERRFLAAIKRRESARLKDVAVARGALFPGGGRQERALSFVPLLATHGGAALEALRGAARAHVAARLGLARGAG